jgi:hypothetical protein
MDVNHVSNSEIERHVSYNLKYIFYSNNKPHSHVELYFKFHFFLDLLKDVVPRDGSTLLSNFLLKIISGVPLSAFVSLP